MVHGGRKEKSVPDCGARGKALASGEAEAIGSSIGSRAISAPMSAIGNVSASVGSGICETLNGRLATITTDRVTVINSLQIA